MAGPTRRDDEREVRIPVLPTSEEADRVVDALLPDRGPSRRLERRAAARVVPAETRPGDHATERGGAMTDDELEAIRGRLGRRVHHVTPDHEAALALLAEVDRLRREAVRYRAAVSEHLHRRMQDVLGEYDAAQEHRREAAEDMRRRAVEVCESWACDSGLVGRDESDTLARVAHQIAALPTSTEAPDGG